VLKVKRRLLESLVESEDCWFDCNGACQAHGYFGMEPGEICPQMELKILLGYEAGVRE
jgi:hypothetical protein